MGFKIGKRFQKARKTGSSLYIRRCSSGKLFDTFEIKNGRQGKPKKVTLPKYGIKHR